MNQVRAIQELNKRELEHGIKPKASWHTDYRDTAYIYFGGLPYALSEGDVIVIFSQYGEPVFIKLARDKETGKSKGFGWLKYRDQRSTDLAVDNLGGAEVLGRVLRVDHARFKMHEDDDPEEGRVDWESMMRMEGKAVEESESESESDDGGNKSRSRGKRVGMLEEEKELAALQREHDEDDPMKAYLIEEKKKEVSEAKERRERKEKKERHRHHRSHRSRRHESDDDERRERRRRRRSPDEGESRRERGSRRKSPEREGSNDEDADPYEAEREKQRRDKERTRGGEKNDDGDRDRDRERERRRRRERDDSRDRRRDRDDRDRHRRDRRRSRSP